MLNEEIAIVGTDLDVIGVGESHNLLDTRRDVVDAAEGCSIRQIGSRRSGLEGEEPGDRVSLPDCARTHSEYAANRYASNWSCGLGLGCASRGLEGA